MNVFFNFFYEFTLLKSLYICIFQKIFLILLHKSSVIVSYKRFGDF